MKTFTSGARSSEEAPRLDLIPLASLKRQADRMQMGAESHGERNYEKGATDPVFIRDRKNHLAWHVAQYLAGNEDDDHLGAILANAGMLARLEEMGAVPERATWTYDEKRANPVRCHCGRDVHNGQQCASRAECIMDAHPHERKRVACSCGTCSQKRDLYTCSPRHV